MTKNTIKKNLEFLVDYALERVFPKYIDTEFHIDVYNTGTGLINERIFDDVFEHDFIKQIDQHCLDNLPNYSINAFESMEIYGQVKGYEVWLASDIGIYGRKLYHDIMLYHYNSSHGVILKDVIVSGLLNEHSRNHPLALHISEMEDEEIKSPSLEVYNTVRAFEQYIAENDSRNFDYLAILDDIDPLWLGIHLQNNALGTIKVSLEQFLGDIVAIKYPIVEVPVNEFLDNAAFVREFKNKFDSSMTSQIVQKWGIDEDCTHGMRC